MTACVLSTLVVSLVQRESIYTMKLKRLGIDPEQRPDVNPLKTLYGAT
jgi:hypothetical protein